VPYKKGVVVKINIIRMNKNWSEAKPLLLRLNFKYMKLILFSFMAACASTVSAQPQVLNKAVINATMTIVAPDDEDVSNIQSQDAGRGGGFNFRNMGDGETKTVTYLKGDLLKTVAKTDMGRTTIIRDNSQKKTTTLIEMMGNKTGFYATDEEQAAMRISMDSAMKARQKDTATTERRPASAPVPVAIAHTNETKKIAGYNCNKAYLISTRFLGLKDSVTVWFTPEIKSSINITSLGGGMSMMASGGNTGTQANGLDLVDGFVMRYETKMRRNRTMIIEINKIDAGKEIADKEFEIPKDFDVKPMKEMRNMMGGGGAGGMQFEIRRGN
jgi:GLPGLI family protein